MLSLRASEASAEIAFVTVLFFRPSAYLHMTSHDTTSAVCVLDTYCSWAKAFSLGQL